MSTSKLLIALGIGLFLASVLTKRLKTPKASDDCGCSK